jgi:translation initiation factor 6
MDIQRYNYEGNINIGFYVTTSQEQSIVPPEFKRKEELGTDYCETFIARTRLVGLFTAGNSNCILLPDTITDRERRKLEESNIDYQVIDTKETALGNQILANDSGALISERLEDRKEDISDALEVPVEVGEIAGIGNVGSTAVTNSYGAVIHRDASEDEAEKLKEVLDLEDVDIGTVNTGSPFVGSGAAANDNVILVGEDTSGPEIGRIDRTMVQRD